MIQIKEELLIEFNIPAGINNAKDIYNHLLTMNPFFSLFKKETKHFSKQLATAQNTI